MSYTVLALKWRPKRFSELVGQPHVVQALVNSLADQRLHHAYLFSGTRGVGKTTVARILAKALNCTRGVVAEPCGECNACVAIDEGRFVDLIEVDAASRTRVDDTRELLDNVQYAPSLGRYKVYLIDEVHMLSTHSFNALLKTLEEPPPHVKFLLATTDPQKLPVTVLSRCLQFHLKKLSAAQMEEQLAKICVAEGVAAEAEGLHALARAAEGSMRDALSLLDQGIAFGGGAIRTEQIAAMLGSIDREHVATILKALAEQDGAALVAEAERLADLAVDFGAVLDELMSALQQIAVIQLVAGKEIGENHAVFAPFAEGMSAEDVQLFYEIALHGRRDLAVCRDARMGFEMSLLRMLAFRPADAADETQKSSSAPGAAVKRTVERSTARQSPEAPGADGSPSPPSRRTSAANGARAAVEPPPEAAPPELTKAEDAYERVSSRDDAPPREGPSDAEIDLRAGGWGELLSAAQIRGAARQLGDNCEVQGSSHSKLKLVLASDKQHLLTEQIRSRLEQGLTAHFGAPVRVSITPGAPPRPTPAELRIANENERMRDARRAIEQDPTVQAVQSAFGAIIEPDTVQPTDGNK